MQWRVKFAGLSLICLAAVGCWRSSSSGGGTTSTPVEFDEGPNISLTVDENEVHITPEADAQPVGVFADDVPIHPSAVFSVTTKSPEGVFATYHASPPGANVAEFYVSSLEQNGWQIESRREAGPQVVSATKGDRRLVVSIAGEAPSGVRVTLTESRP